MKDLGGASLEPFEDRNITSAVCRSTPNGISDLTSKINDCMSSDELKRNNKFISNAFHLQDDILGLRINAMDSLALGDSMFGQYGHADMTKQVKERNTELKQKKQKLENDIDHKERIIQRSNRDFTDVKDTLPETMPKRFLYFIEDYTLAFLCISYIFMVCAIIYQSMMTSVQPWYFSMMESGVKSIILTLFLGILLYYFA
jgi:hypothetical protein